MITFSNITAEEFIRLNQDSIPDELVNFLNELCYKISELKEEVESLRKSDELAWEQVSFAIELIEQLDNFSKNNLSKPKQKIYNQIRENTYFEV